MFQLNNKAKSSVAGLQVTSGKMKVTGQHTFNFRVIRDGNVILDAYDGDVELKRFKDTVHEVLCGCSELCMRSDGFVFPCRLKMVWNVVWSWVNLMTCERATRSSVSEWK